MREHWQPTIFGRLEFKQLPRPFRVVSATLSTAISLALAACGPTPAPLPINPEKTKIPSTLIAQKSTLENFLPFKGLSRFTGGPHDSFRKGGIRDGIDIAPDVPVACSPGVRMVLDEPLVVASASGTVKKVGNEKDPNDPSHSIVETQNADGSIVGAVHLDQIPVSVGDKVIGGETVIGKVSCEVPEGGYTEAMHVHVYVRDKNGKQIPIEGHTFSGYTAHAAAKESDGTMVREDGQVITAIDGKRCGPDESSIKACDGDRNDLTTEAVLGESVKVAPLPTVAAAKPALSPTPAERAPEPGLTRYRSTRNPYQIDYPDGWRILYEELAGQKIETFLHPTDPLYLTIQIATEKINPWVTLNDYKEKWLNQKYKAGSNFAVVAISSDQFVPKGIAGKDVWIIDTSGSYGGIKALILTDKDLGWLFTFGYKNSNAAETVPIINKMIASITFRQLQR